MSIETYADDKCLIRSENFFRSASFNRLPNVQIMEKRKSRSMCNLPPISTLSDNMADSKPRQVCNNPTLLRCKQQLREQSYVPLQKLL